jgi:ATP-binding cassette subfamily F protein 3
MLGLATFRGPHLVILDEPTNHLDIDSRSALITALNDFPGAVILVSHDRYLIEACADRIWLVADGDVAPFDGDLNDYQRLVLSARGGGGNAVGQQKDTAPPRVNRTELRRAAAEKRIELAPLRRRIADAEATVKRLTEEISRTEALLAAPGLFARDPAKAAALSKARAAAAEGLAHAEDDWLAASAELEAARV